MVSGHKGKVQGKHRLEVYTPVWIKNNGPGASSTCSQEEGSRDPACTGRRRLRLQRLSCAAGKLGAVDTRGAGASASSGSVSPPTTRCHAEDLRADIQVAAAPGAPLKTLPSAVPSPKTAGGQCRELVLTKLVGRQKEGFGAAPQVMSDDSGRRDPRVLPPLGAGVHTDALTSAGSSSRPSPPAACSQRLSESPVRLGPRGP